MMILGMSSVSFGKSYLCISEIGQSFNHYGDRWKQSKLVETKIIGVVSGFRADRKPPPGEIVSIT